MLKRKLRSNVDSIISGKRRQTKARLDILFESASRPTNVVEALAYVKGLVDWRKFCNKFPAVVLRSQLYALLTDHTQIDTEINRLRCQGQIIIIKLDTASYGIVEKADYQKSIDEQVLEDTEFDSVTAGEFSDFCRQDDLDVEITSKQLCSHISEGGITKLVRAGFLTPEVTGMFYMTVPNASLLLRTLSVGSKHLRSVISRSKFKEILLSELLARSHKKTSKLGVTYYALDLIGSETVRLVNTTSGPLLRYVGND